jgi:tetratricopeptide (TPR) repeat protein
MQLAGEAVTAEPLEPLKLKGKGKPVPAWRLLSVAGEAPLRHFDAPFVGRSHELQALSEAWDTVRTEQRCELVTVVGAAGVGKSRLLSELLLQVDAEVAHGRCLSYGAGITYWPVVEMLKQLQPRLADVDPVIAGPLRALLDDQGTASTDELAWAFRKFVEAVSREQPLVLAFDDIHWGEEALLDLIEHVAVVSTGAPILLVCMARPELLDRRPGWRGLVRLEPLSPTEAQQLILARLGGRDPGDEVSQRILAAAEGNPLFVQEMAAMLQESSDDEVAVPPTIQALLAARLDQLDEAERTVLEAAAVEGEVFHRSAVQALAPDEPRLTAQLTALVRKEFVRPERPALEGEDGFRFRHLLVRDATYDAIPKATRSGLHERYADWLEGRAEPLDAFVGYHLEQAYHYRIDLRDTGAEVDALALRASDRLERAATAALNRSDLRAAIGLLDRASSLPPVPDGRRARLMVDLAATHADAGELTDAERILDAANELAATTDDECAGARMLVEHQFLEVHRATAGATEGVPDVVKHVLPIFERLEDHHGLCRAWQLQATADWTHGLVSAAAAAWERAAEHARTAGEEHERADIATWLASSTWFGAMPVDAGVRRCEEIQREVRGHPTSEAAVLRHLGGLHGLAGRLELARSLFAASNAAFADLGLELHHVLSHSEAVVEMLAGDFAAAELRLRRGFEILESMGENYLRSTTAAYLARAVLAQGRNEEADWLSEVSEGLAEPDDIATQILWRGVRARVLAEASRFDEAERLAREAVALAEHTDLLNDRADVLVDLAAVLEADGRAAEASATVTAAIRLYEMKGNTLAAEVARAKLDVLAAI